MKKFINENKRYCNKISMHSIFTRWIRMNITFQLMILMPRNNLKNRDYLMKIMKIVNTKKMKTMDIKWTLMMMIIRKNRMRIWHRAPKMNQLHPQCSTRIKTSMNRSNQVPISNLMGQVDHLEESTLIKWFKKYKTKIINSLVILKWIYSKHLTQRLVKIWLRYKKICSKCRLYCNKTCQVDLMKMLWKWVWILVK